MNPILETLNEIITLLSAGGWPEQAKWYEQEKNTLLEKSGEDLIQALLKIKKTLAGMGSFTDLPLKVNNSIGLSEEKLRQKQFSLANLLGEQINKFCKETGA